jgi:ribosome-associated toxin RatA of RatAB toxin-antitoxin module
MAKVNHTEYFNCTPEEFFSILQDYEKYSDFLPEVKSCKVKKKSDEKKEVEYKVSLIKSFSYINEQYEKPPYEISWKFLKGDIFKKMSGGWKLSEEKGRTKAEYFAEAEFGLFVPGMITKTLMSVNLPMMMQAYHKRVKELYGK